MVPSCVCTNVCTQDQAARGRYFYPPATGDTTPGGEGEGFSWPHCHQEDQQEPGEVSMKLTLSQDNWNGSCRFSLFPGHEGRVAIPPPSLPGEQGFCRLKWREDHFSASNIKSPASWIRYLNNALTQPMFPLIFHLGKWMEVKLKRVQEALEDHR